MFECLKKIFGSQTGSGETDVDVTVGAADTPAADDSAMNEPIPFVEQMNARRALLAIKHAGGQLEFQIGQHVEALELLRAERAQFAQLCGNPPDDLARAELEKMAAEIEAIAQSIEDEREDHEQFKIEYEQQRQTLLDAGVRC